MDALGELFRVLGVGGFGAVLLAALELLLLPGCDTAVEVTDLLVTVTGNFTTGLFSLFELTVTVDTTVGLDLVGLADFGVVS